MWYELRRVGQGVLTYVFASTIAFVMYRMMPGGPVQMIAQNMYQQCQRTSGACNFERIKKRVELRVNIDPDKPIPAAYVDYLSDVIFHLDFGESFTHGRPVFDLLFSVMPWTIFISMFGLVLSFTFNIFWGAALAYKEGTRFDKYGTLFALTGSAIPYYVAAILALAYLGFAWQLFPFGGRYPDAMALELPLIGEVMSWSNIQRGFNSGFIIGVIWSASLPVFTNFILGVSGLGMRGNAIRVMESDYIQVARLRGLSQARIAQRYVARNAILPLYTGLMINISGVFSGSVITEQIFSYFAVGYYTFQALENRDYPLLMGSFLFLVFFTIIGILIADLTYKYIDPRAGGEDREAY